MLKWNNSTDWNTVCCRASGRRGYNAHRQFVAAHRQFQVVNYLSQFGLKKYGTQKQIAALLGVSESTISRDVAVLEAHSRPCKCCGKWHNSPLPRPN